jgi:hypothetical protein
VFRSPTLFILFTILLSVVQTITAQNCLSDPFLNSLFETDDPACSQQDVCGLPCPVPVSPPTAWYSIAIIAAIAISFLIGMATLVLVQGKAENFFVAGRSLPLLSP